MILSQLGEFDLINRIKTHCDAFTNNDLILGIGDDCALFPMNERYDGLITTDLLLETIHFSEETSAMWDLGVKSMEVNVSDIAAMGGIPLYCTVSMALHSDSTLIDVESFYRGLTDTATEYNIAIIGGDTSHSPQNMFVSITLIGKVEKGKALLRSNAKNDDLICVTGSLGASFVGLKWLLSGLKKNDVIENAGEGFADSIDYCIQRHQLPKARISTGRLLLEHNVASACIDLSDGLASDLTHVIRESNLGAHVNLNKIPMDKRAISLAKILNIDPIRAKTTGGEDYELLFTVPPQKKKMINLITNETGISITIIGQMTDDSDQIRYDLNGKPYDYNLCGYDHFSHS